MIILHLEQLVPKDNLSWWKFNLAVAFFTKDVPQTIHPLQQFVPRQLVHGQVVPKYNSSPDCSSSCKIHPQRQFIPRQLVPKNNLSPWCTIRRRGQIVPKDYSSPGQFIWTIHHLVQFIPKYSSSLKTFIPRQLVHGQIFSTTIFVSTIRHLVQFVPKYSSSPGQFVSGLLVILYNSSLQCNSSPMTIHPCIVH
jgi:hypothetical protein